MGEDLPARRFAGFRDLLGVNSDHNALIAEFLGGFFDKGPAGHGGGIDRDFVGAGTQQRADILDAAHAAADRERHEAGFGGAAHHVEHDTVVLVTCGDVEKRELIGAGFVISDRGGDRVAGIAQIDEIDAFDDTAILDVEAGNDAGLEHLVSRFRSS